MKPQLIIESDQAWEPQEQERRLRPFSPGRAERRKARRRIYMRGYRARNRETIRGYNRDWMARQRVSEQRLVGSLHSLACTGPTKDTGCRCSKVRCYSKPR